MLVLGIANNDLAGACLVGDGAIVAAASEERFTRIKDHKTWPARSIEFVLDEGRTSLDAVDALAYSWHAGFDADRHLLLYVDRIAEEVRKNADSYTHLRKRISDEMANDKQKRREFDDFVDSNGLRSKVAYVDHHEAHGLGAFLCSPFDAALVVSCDGRGDFQSLTVAYYTEKNTEVLQRETSVDSLGYFYGRITSLLGYRANRHEGKITGLAASGNPVKALPLMRQMIHMDDVGRIRALCGDFFQPSYDGYTAELIAEIAKHDPADVAAAAQAHIESILSTVVARHIATVPTGNVCLSGGVFANVKLNQRISETAGVHNVYVMPPMGDGGLPLQAAVVVSHRRTARRPKVPSMALGPDATISTAQLDEILREFPALSVRRIDHGMEKAVVDTLADGRVVGTFRGRMEFGPRALGNRSVLYRTDDVTINDWLNARLNRTEFMPFAPITAEELAPKCYIGWSSEQVSARFMTITYDCYEQFSKTCPAVVHVDNTARPQVVREQDDPFLHRVLLSWYERTGQAALVNTSLNKHEEPIVGSHRDAIDALRSGAIDVLVVDDTFVIWDEARGAADVPDRQ